MRIRLIISTLILISQIKLLASGPLAPVAGNFYLGASRSTLGAAMNSLQAGFILSPSTLPLYIGLETNINRRSRNYEWPGVGSYRYTRSYTNGTLSFGFKTFRRYSFNLYTGISIYGYTVKGQYSTDDQVLKGYLKDYTYQHYNACLNLRVSYKVSGRFTAYGSFNMIHTTNYSSPVWGIGIMYNMYDKKM
jgi:hypothetical protein